MDHADEVRVLNPPFCVIPFKAMTYTPSGMAKPCCSFKGHVTAPDGQPMKLGKSASDDIWNSAFMQRLRQAMAEGRPAAGCEVCAWHESLGIASVGRRMTEAWLNGFLNSAGERRATTAERPAWLDVHLGNTCNLKCRTCSAAYSSAISADPVHAGWAPAEEMPGHWFRDPKTLFEDIFRDPGRLRVLNLSGGEPLLIKQAREILRRLVESGAAAHIHLSFVTNGTAVDEAFCQLVAGFKRVFVLVSLDGIGEINEYLRFNSTWTEVEAGIRLLRRMPNADIHVNTVVSAYNSSTCRNSCTTARQKAFRGTLPFSNRRRTCVPSSCPKPSAPRPPVACRATSPAKEAPKRLVWASCWPPGRRATRFSLRCWASFCNSLAIWTLRAASISATHSLTFRKCFIQW